MFVSAAPCKKKIVAKYSQAAKWRRIKVKITLTHPTRASSLKSNELSCVETHTSTYKYSLQANFRYPHLQNQRAHFSASMPRRFHPCPLAIVTLNARSTNIQYSTMQPERGLQWAVAAILIHSQGQARLPHSPTWRLSTSQCPTKEDRRVTNTMPRVSSPAKRPDEDPQGYVDHHLLGLGCRCRRVQSPHEDGEGETPGDSRLPSESLGMWHRAVSPPDTRVGLVLTKINPLPHPHANHHDATRAPITRARTRPAQESKRLASKHASSSYLVLHQHVFQGHS